VDCDVLHDTDTDLKIVIYTAAPGSEEVTKLDLTRVTGVYQEPAEGNAPGAVAATRPAQG